MFNIVLIGATKYVVLNAWLCLSTYLSETASRSVLLAEINLPFDGNAH